jgi:integrase/recombinase XerD
MAKQKTGTELTTKSTADTVVVSDENRMLTAEEFRTLADVPAEVEWFANIENPNTRRAYQADLKDFMAFVGIKIAEEFRIVTRSHLIAWRKSLEVRELAPATIRRKLSALSSLFDFLCEANAVTYNPSLGVKRPSEGTNEGKTAAVGDDQAAALLEAPSADTLKGKRDRAVLSVLLYHGLRRDELCKLRVKDLEARRGVPHFVVSGKRSKLRYVPIHPHTLQTIEEYLGMAGHREDIEGALFRPVKNPVQGELAKPLSTNAVYKDIVKRYATDIGIDPRCVCPHGLRATAATNALEHEADIAKVQEWLGHCSISTTRLYDRRKMRPEESPTFKVVY